MTTDTGQDARTRISAEAASAMRGAIEEAGGNEVFFAGSMNSSGLIEGVRVCARGHEGAVPAIFDGLDARDVVIHNHPTGDVLPSDADLELAVVYSHNGHGVYIVDNGVSRVYVVVEAFREKDRTRLVPVELARLLGPESRIAEALPEYEERPQQEEMLEAISRSFNEDGMAVIEAPTGVGKTLAYLLPAVFWAVRNRERVVISTRTINLQEQIVFKDVPLLQRCLDLKFAAVLVKGRSNYVCPRRLERALSEATLFDDAEDQTALKTIAEWAAHTEDGSKSDLSFVPTRDVWERVCSEADTCTTSQCMASNKCFVTKARREIAKADLIVVNHHMLFSDLAIKKETGKFSSVAVLPAFERLILDEAHHIEDSATEYFGVEATQNGAQALLGRFQRKDRGQDRGLLMFIKVRLVQEAPALSHRDAESILELIDNTLLPAIAACREALTAAFQAIRSLCAEKCGQVGRDIKWRLTQDVLDDPQLREIHAVYVLPAAEELTRLAQHCSALHKPLSELEPGPNDFERPLAMEASQLQAYRDRLLRLANTMAEATGATLEANTVRWIEIDAQKNRIVRLVRCPLEVGKPLAEWVYPNLKTVAMTSATLTVQNKFDFLFNRIGLDLVTDRNIDRAVLSSPFDFQEQALLCVPDDIPAPGSDAFLDESILCIRNVLEATGGHAFVLFTSFHALNAAYTRLEKELRAQGITPLKQGAAARTQLLERFRRDVSSVLFATDSFWEGVDVPGAALQCVILARLPFRVPTEPILQARTETVEQSGGNAFMDYIVPLAVIKFRQGFGRLIRRRTDRGVVVVLDSRVLTKQYGKKFLDSLPDVRLSKGPGEDVLHELEDFCSAGENLAHEPGH